MDDLVQHCLRELAFEGDYGELQAFQSCFGLFFSFHERQIATRSRSFA